MTGQKQKKLPYKPCHLCVDRMLRLDSLKYYPPTVCQLHLFQNTLHSHHLSIINYLAKEKFINLEILKKKIAHENARNS